MEVDILEFQVPLENNKTLFVWDIQPSYTEAHIYDRLHRVFSSFGPLYLLKVCPNAPLSPPGFYALIKFYSAAQASKAQRRTDGRLLFQDSPLKVRLSSKQMPQFLSNGSRPLSHARCVDLANHCLGFNGWTSDIITVRNHLRLTPQLKEFGCLLQLSFPHHGQTTRASAVVEERFTCTGPEVFLQRRCKLHRLVRERALVQAFSAVLLILLGDGKVMVEVKRTSDQLLPEDTEGVLQVSCSPDDEEEWDLTVS
uniref:RAD52 motif-containing protein 1 n=1 Tax=Labrus bergylta TaxID=56723 RepID=A0A3Q3GUS8_9LABR